MAPSDVELERLESVGVREWGSEGVKEWVSEGVKECGSGTITF